MMFRPQRLGRPQLALRQMAVRQTTEAGRCVPRQPGQRAWGFQTRIPTRTGFHTRTERCLRLPPVARFPLGPQSCLPFCQRATHTTTATPTKPLPDLDQVVARVTEAKDRLLSHRGLPSEEEVHGTLRICGEAADQIMDATVQPQLSSRDHQADTAASTLLSMEEGEGVGGGSGGVGAERPPKVMLPPRLRDVVAQISEAAYAVVSDRRVVLTTDLLSQYVDLQARLGRPETLPTVLEQYANKPAPKLVEGKENEIEYSTVDPKRTAAAVPPYVASAALDAAIAAQNLDAAVGIVEQGYASSATVRRKLIARGLLPGLAVVGVPIATWLLASRLAALQDTMDDATATRVAFAAIVTYVVCTGAIGVVANATANDQMRRVTWAPGTPLRERWLREDERAALDTVACAFGFSEEHRYGEEEGEEFQALREYILRKGMLLDQTELIEGMNS